MGMILAKIFQNWSTASGGKPYDLVPSWKWAVKAVQAPTRSYPPGPTSVCPEMIVDMGNFPRRKSQGSQKIDGRILPERRTRGSRGANPGMSSTAGVVFFSILPSCEGGMFAILPISQWKVLL